MKNVPRSSGVMRRREQLLDVRPLQLLAACVPKSSGAVTVHIPDPAFPVTMKITSWAASARDRYRFSLSCKRLFRPAPPDHAGQRLGDGIQELDLLLIADDALP